MANREDAKKWFETGDYPTQAQFAQVLDWIRFKQDPIGVDDITNLITILQGKASQAALDALADAINREAHQPSSDFEWPLMANKRLSSLIFVASVNMTVKAGTVPGGNNVMIETDLVAGQPFIHDCAEYAVDDKIIYFTIPALTDLFIYKR